MHVSPGMQTVSNPQSCEWEVGMQTFCLQI
jgi:hypothetical protein